LRTSLFGIAASLAIACFLAAGAASAAAPYQTKLTISRFLPTWHGKVLSSGDLLHGVRSCERKRLVKVYKRREGKDRLIGTDTSNRAGRWAVADEPTKGIYYAKVTERRPGDKPPCAGDQSGIQVVD
jgi:hypothetical protein